MSKYTVLFFAFIASIAMTSALKPEEELALKTEALPFIYSCAEEYGISKEAMLAAEASQNTEALDACFYYCFFKKAGIMNDDGLFDTEVAQKKGKELFKTEESRGSVADIINKCAAVNEQTVADKCERSKHLLVCFAKEKSSK